MLTTVLPPGPTDVTRRDADTRKPSLASAADQIRQLPDVVIHAIQHVPHEHTGVAHDSRHFRNSSWDIGAHLDCSRRVKPGRRPSGNFACFRSARGKIPSLAHVCFGSEADFFGMNRLCPLYLQKQTCAYVCLGQSATFETEVVSLIRSLCPKRGTELLDAGSSSVNRRDPRMTGSAGTNVRHSCGKEERCSGHSWKARFPQPQA